MSTAPSPLHPGVRVDPGSFRDPGNQVLYLGDEVLRGLGPAAAENWRALAASDFFPRLVRSGKVCRTEVADAVRLPAEVSGAWHTVLRHERIPVISYPYEWGFSMQRDAALLQLEILRAALAEGFTMRDGSAYNIQWRGVDPVFIDVGSFAPARDAGPWAGYRQFCQTLLYPLLMQAHLDLDPRPWLRSRIDGVEASEIRNVFSGARRFRRGVFTHVHLHAALQRRYAGSGSSVVRTRLREAGYTPELTLAAVAALEKLVARLDWTPPPSPWTGYRHTCTYSAADRAAKELFVTAALAEAEHPRSVLDLGANDGDYARLAVRYADRVLAVDQDPAVVDQLYRNLRAEGVRRIQPLVMDLADPSCGGGWRGVERSPFAARAAADVVLALAVVHHLVLGRNVPLAEVVDWLSAFLIAAGGRGRLVVEFVHPEDPMARRLLADKPAGLFPDYHRAEFERLLERRFVIRRRAELPGGTRTLYVGLARG